MFLGREIWIILDSGAQQTILPRNVVDSDCLTGKSCKLCDWERSNVRSRDVSIRADEYLVNMLLLVMTWWMWVYSGCLFLTRKGLIS